MTCPPVLFLIFNRPEQTAQVFARIREARPSRLFVAADGPRSQRPDEKKQCDRARDIVDQGVDWDCQVERLYRTENLGCKIAVSDAITWFFRQVEEGIVLEDDCLPDATFFHFCAELLERYRLDSQVFQISGFNPVTRGYKWQQSYAFWYFGSIWGWASWRRAWAHYDRDMKDWPDFLQSGRLAELCTSELEATERAKAFGDTHAGRYDTWDYQWAFARLFHRALSVTPAVNLVRNLGFGENATHTHDAADRRARQADAAIHFPLKHPPSVSPDRSFGPAYWAGVNGTPAAAPTLIRRAIAKARRLWRAALS